MKKNIFLVFFFLVVSTFLIIMQKNNKIFSPVTSIEKAFAATGAVAVSSEIYIRGTAEDDTAFDEEAEQKALILEIIESFGGDAGKAGDSVKKVGNDISDGFESDYIIDDERNISIAVLKTKGEGQKSETHVSVSLTSTSGSPDMKSAYSNLVGLFEKNKIDYDVNLRITGSIDGKLDDGELEEMYRKVFNEVGADKVEGIDDNGLVSVTAFSPSMGNAVRVNGRKVNLNMATRYNSYEGKTYIWLATPVIATDY